MEHKSGCLICGAELVYYEAYRTLTCYYCGDNYKTNARCKNNHYVCDKCHISSANELIEKYCVNSKDTNPITIALELMKTSAIKMHGPEHHFLVPAVLLSAFCNQKRVPLEEKIENIAQARKRAEIVIGGFCGYYGACGAAIGTGIFMSIITKATPMSKEEWRLCNRMTAESLLKISDQGGPRCCKRDSFLAILQATEVIRKQFDITLAVEKPILCEFSSLNAGCLNLECQFFTY